MRRQPGSAMRTRLICMWAAAALLPVGASAQDFKVHMPDAETGEFAIEPIGAIGLDPLAAHSGGLSSVTEFEYGVNRFWRTELELRVLTKDRS